MMSNIKAMRLIAKRKNEIGETNGLTVLILVQGVNIISVIFNSQGGKGDEK